MLLPSKIKNSLLIIIYSLGFISCNSLPNHDEESIERSFNRIVTSARSGDWGQFVDLMTEETKNNVTVGMFILPEFLGLAGSRTMLNSFKTEDKSAKEKTKHLLDLAKKIHLIREKHGISEKSLTNLKSLETKEDFSKFASMVKNKDVFITEVFSTLISVGEGKAIVDSFLEVELLNIKINGDNATATARMSNGKEKQIKFKKVNGSWFFHLSPF